MLCLWYLCAGGWSIGADGLTDISGAQKNSLLRLSRREKVWSLSREDVSFLRYGYRATAALLLLRRILRLLRGCRRSGLLLSCRSSLGIVVSVGGVQIAQAVLEQADFNAATTGALGFAIF